MATVLVVGRTPAALNDAEGEVRKAGLSFIGSTDETEAVAVAKANQIDALILGAGLPYEMRRRIRREIRLWHPEAEVIELRGPHLTADDLWTIAP